MSEQEESAQGSSSLSEAVQGQITTVCILSTALVLAPRRRTRNARAGSSTNSSSTLNHAAVETTLILWLITALQAQPMDLIVHLIFVSLLFTQQILQFLFSNPFFEREGMLRYFLFEYGIPISLLCMFVCKLIVDAMFHKKLGTTGTSSALFFYCISATVCFPLVFVLLQSQKRSTFKRRIGSSTDGVFRNFGTIDETKWYDWSYRETLEWLLATSEEGENDENKELAECLRGELIRGNQLPYISLQEWHSDMGVPFGCAKRIIERIQRLVQSYPPPYQVDDMAPASLYSINNGWLSEHDRMYNRTSGDMLPDLSMARQTARNSAPAIDDDLGIEPDISYVNEISRRRLGIELPVKMFTEEYAVPNTQQESTDGLVNASANVSSQLKTEPQRDFLALPADFVKNMPPHIAEIAMRKPELVQKIIESKRNNVGERADLLDLSDGNYATYDSMTHNTTAK